MGRNKQKIIGIGQIRAMTYNKSTKLDEAELSRYIKAAKGIIETQIFGNGKQEGLLDKYKKKLLKNPDTPLPPVIAHSLQRAASNNDGIGIQSKLPYKTPKEIRAIEDLDERRKAREDRKYAIAQNKIRMNNNIQFIESWYFDESAKWRDRLNITYNGRNDALSAFSELRLYATRKTLFESGFKEYNKSLRTTMEQGIMTFQNEEYKLTKEEFDRIVRIMGRLGKAVNTNRERFYEAERNLVLMYRQGEFTDLSEEEIASKFNDFEKGLKQAEFEAGNQETANSLIIKKKK